MEHKDYFGCLRVETCLNVDMLNFFCQHFQVNKSCCSLGMNVKVAETGGLNLNLRNSSSGVGKQDHIFAPLIIHRGRKDVKRPSIKFARDGKILQTGFRQGDRWNSHQSTNNIFRVCQTILPATRVLLTYRRFSSHCCNKSPPSTSVGTTQQVTLCNLQQNDKELVDLAPVSLEFVG